MLLISCGFVLFFGIKSTINVLSFDKAKRMDGFIYILCYLLLLLFLSLEIANTIISFKYGSVYIKGLAFNDNNTINRNSLIVTGGIAAFSIYAIIYITLVIKGRNLKLYKLDIEAKYFILVSSIALLTNAIAVLVFPLLAKEDQSFDDKKK